MSQKPLRNNPVDDFLDLFSRKSKITHHHIIDIIQTRQSKVAHEEYVYETESQELSMLMNNFNNVLLSFVS